MHRKNDRSKHSKMKMCAADILTVTICKLICFAALLLFAIPIAYVLLASVYNRNSGWSMDGYLLLLNNKLVLTGLKNSIFLAACGSIYSLTLEIPAAYFLSKKEKKQVTDLFFYASLFGSALLPLYLLLKEIHLLNTLWALILPCGLSIRNTQILRARMINLSTELEDAATMDGCHVIDYLLRICIPNIGPTVGVLAFFHAAGYWCSTLYAKTFLTDESKFPLTLVLEQVLIRNQTSSVLGSASSGASIAALQNAEFALCVISTLPLVLLFLLMKDKIRTLEIDGGLVL